MTPGLEPLEAWAKRHGLDECYRVTKEPNARAGLLVSVWCLEGVWFADRQVLRRWIDPRRVVAGLPIARSSARVLVSLLDEVEFWEERTWPDGLCPDGEKVCFEGVREGRSRCRQAWSPDEIRTERAWRLLECFDAIRPNRFLWWRRVELPVPDRV